MIKFNIEIERNNKTQSPLPILFDKALLFRIYFQSSFMSRTLLVLHIYSVFLLIYLIYYLCIYSFIISQSQGNNSSISPIYREILRQQNAFSF